MASNDEYQQYNFAQELVNIDAAVDAVDAQLNIATAEIEKLAKLCDQMQQHHTMYKQVWRKHNVEKLTEILKKSKNLDNIMWKNF